ncbi:hypothetical protein MTO96_025598 [Rhipicephalus appendiculatus]
MQLDPKLTLQSATKLARNSEVVKQQQTEIRRKEHPTVAVDEVRKSGHGKGIPKEHRLEHLLAVYAPRKATTPDVVGGAEEPATTRRRSV